MAAEYRGYAGLFCRSYCIKFMSGCSPDGKIGRTAQPARLGSLEGGVDAALQANNARRLRDQNTLAHL